MTKYFKLLLTGILLIGSTILWAHNGHEHPKKDTVRAKDTVQSTMAAPAVSTTTTSTDLPATDFPNLHPMVVHFPIVLLLVGAFMQLFAFWVHHRSYHWSIAAIVTAGFVTAYLASTYFHAHASDNISQQAKEIFEQHEQLAAWTVRLAGAGALLKIGNLFLGNMKWLNGVVAAVLIAAAVSVGMAGHRGAEMVHKFDIGPKGNWLEQGDHD